ncbi:MAG: ribulose-phosphate 3-epimerase [Lachnospiraceae bacterium]|nr:ribulose-phosphate 3-epimerase [Lachnospiraceae bacterium]MCR5024812.1 ribulose-phosphate 3-epimerase [Lachnospiraceae bacterium]
MNYKISPSILAADFNDLGDNIALVEKERADYLHIDVMDGVFVPSISFGMPVIKSIRKKSSLFFDVHLMIVDPDRYIENFAECGADGITVHLEASKDIDRTVSLIRSTGKKVGLSISPETPVSDITDEILKKTDMILVMTVRPGFGGQKYMDECTQKIREVRKRAEELGMDLDIEVDGGIDRKTITTVIDAGANVIVMGSSIFNGDIRQNMKYFRKVLGI